MHCFNKLGVITRKLPRLLCKYGITLICLFAFLLQFEILLDEYLSGSTVVSITIEKFQKEILPAFTLCYPVPWTVSFEKAAKNGKEFIELKSLYEKQLKTFDFGNTNQTLPDNETKAAMNDIYQEMLEKIDFTSISLYEFLENYSIPSNK